MAFVNMSVSRNSSRPRQSTCKALIPCVMPAEKENVMPNPNESSLQMSFPSYHHYQQHQQPDCSFAGAVLQNCMINVCSPQVEQQRETLRTLDFVHLYTYIHFINIHCICIHIHDIA